MIRAKIEVIKIGEISRIQENILFLLYLLWRKLCNYGKYKKTCTHNPVNRNSDIMCYSSKFKTAICVVHWFLPYTSGVSTCKMYHPYQQNIYIYIYVINYFYYRMCYV